MQIDWPESIRRLLLSEGGYVNHPDDPGGPTNFGVTIADYRRYMNSAATAADIRAMTRAEAISIYKPKYWDTVKGDALPAGVDYCTFDYGVNSGPSRAVKVLQRVMGLQVTGRMSDADIRAAGSRDAAALINSICDERLRFMKSLKIWPAFGKGWTRRVAEVRAASLAMAAHAGAVKDVPAPAAPSIVPEIPQHSGEVVPGKAVVPESTATKGVVKGSPGGLLLWAISAKSWVMAHPLESAAIACVAVAAVFVVIRTINGWRRARQERPMGVRVVPAI